MKNLRFIILVSSILIIGWATQEYWAEEALSPEVRSEALIDEINASLVGIDDINRVLNYEKQLNESILQLEECINQESSQLEEINLQLDELGEAIPGEAEAITDLREQLSQELVNYRELTLTCRSLKDKSETLLTQVKEKHRILNTEIFTRKESDLKESALDLGEKRAQWTDKIKQSFMIDTTPEASRKSWWLGILFSVLGFVCSLILKNNFSQRLANYREAGGKEPFELNLLTSINEHLPFIFTGALAWFSFYKLNSADSLNLAERLGISLIIIGVIGAYFKWFCRANSPGDELHALNTGIPKAFVGRLQWVVLTSLIGFVLFGTNFLRELPEGGLTLPYQILLIALAVCMLSTLRLSREFPDLKGRSRLLRTALIFASIIAIPATIFGYLNAANYLLFAVLLTQIAILIFRTAMWSLEAIFDGLINGKSKNAYKARATLGIRTEEGTSELSWIRLILGLAIWVIFALVIIKAWDYTQTVLPDLQKLTVEGFKVGEDSRLIPRNILIGLMTFAIVQAITVWLKARMERQWLRNIGMERGARDALVTLMGYIGIFIAIILGLTAAGVSFSGLAIIAGALSVGIGFGLQNIVNNFISGLILLFERPINHGDYISVGTVEGTVKRISIRSTEIETIARTNVIVPNSELITGQVTNWVLHDANGMIQVPVGVAYGTDTELVKTLLLEVANAHTEIITRPNMPQPKVRFKNFGESSLDFALVALIKNINNRFDVISDLNYMIDQKFKENNIEIPFPQRDIHIINPDSSIEDK